MNNLHIIILYKLHNVLSCVSSQSSESSSSCRACRAVLFDKLDTGKIHGLRVVSCRDVSSQVAFGLQNTWHQSQLVDGLKNRRLFRPVFFCTTDTHGCNDALDGLIKNRMNVYGSSRECAVRRYIARWPLFTGGWLCVCGLRQSHAYWQWYRFHFADFRSITAQCCALPESVSEWASSV